MTRKFRTDYEFALGFDARDDMALTATIEFSFTPAGGPEPASYASGGSPGWSASADPERVLALQITNAQGMREPRECPMWLADFILSSCDADALVDAAMGQIAYERENRA